MLAPIENAPNRPSPPPALSSSDVSLGPVVMADDPCEAAFSGEDPTGPRNYYRARYYDPKPGRFVSEDPIGYKGELNFYAYVGENPTNYKDPEGLRKVYGQWCGPDWTGGRKGQFAPHPSGYYTDPKDALDQACQTHDICYYDCRTQFPCDATKRATCFRLCDRTLTNSAYAIGGFWGRTIGGAIDRPGGRDPGPNDPSCACTKK
jgi:RHS repeat-associated protein